MEIRKEGTCTPKETGEQVPSFGVRSALRSDHFLGRCGFSVLSRGAAIIAQKQFRIVAQMRKTAGKGDLGNAHVCGGQQMAADLQAVMIEKINGRLSKVPAKNRTAFTPLLSVYTDFYSLQL